MVHIVDNWPYTDLHNINLDWILNQIKTLGYRMENLEGFFPKISDWNNGEWDIDHAYNPNEIVTNGNDIYMAKTNVPTGVNINNTDYWLLVGTDSYITDKVDKSGDTMTGSLVTPHIDVYDSNSPYVEFSDSANGDAIGSVIAQVSNRRMILRQRSAGGYLEDYYLPANTATENKQYFFITTKDGVLGLMEHTENITIAANTWTQMNINQFYQPAGYKLIALNVAGSENYDARNYLYILLNSVNNANRILMYCSAALDNVPVTLDAWYIRNEDYKTIS